MIDKQTKQIKNFLIKENYINKTFLNNLNLFENKDLDKCVENWIMDWITFKKIKNNEKSKNFYKAKEYWKIQERIKTYKQHNKYKEKNFSLYNVWTTWYYHIFDKNNSFLTFESWLNHYSNKYDKLEIIPFSKS